MTKRKFNVKLLRRVQKKILAQPKGFDMSGYEMDTACGTERCIAGWAIALNHKIGDSIYSLPSMLRSVPLEVASKDLGLSDRESSVLFYYHLWPDKFREPYRKAEKAHSHPRMALWASRMIDWFIAQKKSGKDVTHE